MYEFRDPARHHPGPPGGFAFRVIRNLTLAIFFVGLLLLPVCAGNTAHFDWGFGGIVVFALGVLPLTATILTADCVVQLRASRTQHVTGWLFWELLLTFAVDLAAIAVAARALTL